MSMSVNDVISNYTFTYQNEMRPILDRNADGNWSKEEVNSYAADYQSATGTKLDTEAVFSKYDANSDDLLQYAEYEQASSDDAFGMSLLSQKQSEAASQLGAQAQSSLTPQASQLQLSDQSQLSEMLDSLTSSENTDTEEAVSATANMSDWLQSLNNSTRTSLVNTTVWADNTSNMLNMMLSASNSYSNIGYGLLQYTNVNAFATQSYMATSLFNTTA